MNIRILFTACFLIAFSTLNAQQFGKWTTYLACYTTTSVAEANNYVYAVADGTLYRYGKDDNSIKLYSKQTKLNDTDIKVIRYNPTVKKLMIVYKNGNIDLMDEDDNIKNIPSIKNSSIIQDKTVNFIYFNGNTAYLAAGFGIWEYRLDKEDPIGTYLQNTASYGVCIRNESIYASTATGIRKASVHNNLKDPNNWETVNTSSSDFNSKSIREVYLFNNMVCFRADGSGVYYLDENDNVQTMRSDKDLKGMKLESGYLIPFTSATAYFYESLVNSVDKKLDVVNDISGLKSNGTFWVASDKNGLRGIKRTAENNYDIFKSDLTIEGPKRNLDAFMTIHDGKLLITGGGRWTDRFKNAGTLMVYKDEKWFNFDEEKVNNKVGLCRDYTSVAVDPNDENHYFVSTFGEGILEFKDNEFVQQYNHKNSSLQSIYPNKPEEGNYVRIGSVAFDKAGNLWATNCQVTKGISKRTADGNWIAYPFPGLNSNSYLVDKILVTSRGDKWVNVPRNGTGTGILIFNDEGKSNFESTFRSTGGTDIRSKVCLSMAEDLTGEIWIGTSQGPIYCSNPSRAIDNPDALSFSHIIRQNDAGENFVFLESEQINAIAIDGGNRKWLGTSGSGVYVVSPDGKETIHHFTAENSDLYSNMIQSIAINPQTGEVFIGTDKGLISYQSESTEASESYSDVYAYPNPVRPDFDGSVVITGLMANSNVKITDLSGNLIYQGKSAGGQMVWDCSTQSGNRVATGIYLVLSSTEKAKESVVAKIAVVK